MTKVEIASERLLHVGEAAGWPIPNVVGKRAIASERLLSVPCV